MDLANVIVAILGAAQGCPGWTYYVRQGCGTKAKQKGTLLPSYTRVKVTGKALSKLTVVHGQLEDDHLGFPALSRSPASDPTAA